AGLGTARDPRRPGPRRAGGPLQHAPGAARPGAGRADAGLPRCGPGRRAVAATGRAGAGPGGRLSGPPARLLLRGRGWLMLCHLGIVTMGRKEGERLRRCLRSILGRGLPVVYVDSNSTDGSPELARSLGAAVVELDPSRPVCVPRARNEGFERLCRIDPEVRFVQFLDGDCELV